MAPAHQPCLPDLVDPIQGVIDRAEQRGQPPSDAVRRLLRIWAARNPKMPNTGVNAGKNPSGLTCIDGGSLPVICACFECSCSTVIFPPEEDGPWQGYCICPVCRFPASVAGDLKRGPL